ncbi:restriction endonuclease subunit S [Natronoflexus pectinivorans]|uniref:Type I restriction enzyme S subunit n=1 Tax=Natronoflexus pectinivorans TaxID=682526 RepID=A0A4R2GFI4_9BACT|nr:restriction endonuclease subunit S [Natronoflexus pectinivorans]TCO06965.1 type I restriction enzyme S subunit [Natronoflexus pectinivorans]
MSEIINTTLGEVLEIKYGKDHKKLADGIVPLYGSGGIMRYVEKAIYDKPSIMIPRKGSLNNLFYEDNPFWTVDTLFWTIINEEKVDPKYLFYLLSLHNLSKYDEGSAVPSLTTKALNDVPISFPKSIDTQIEVRTIIENLDQKITLLRQQNQTLEDLAQTLFKRWFVEFEFPNENGEPYKSSGGKMEESELGEIPEGWRIVQLKDIVEIGSSKRIFASEYLQNGIPFYRGKEVTELSNGNNLVPEIFISEQKYNELKNASGVPKNNDILLTSVGTIGNTYLVQKDERFYFKDGNLTWFKSYKTVIDFTFIYIWLKSKYAEIALEGIKIGSTQQAITIDALNTIEIVIPNENNYLKLRDSLKSLIFKQQKNTNEIQTLTQLRDTLLPKLMSGEIRVVEE